MYHYLLFSVALSRSLSVVCCSMLLGVAMSCSVLQHCMYVCIYFGTCTHTRTHTHTCMPVWVCMFVCLYACMHACMYEHMYEYIYVCMYIQYVCVFVRTIHWSAVAGVCVCVCGWLFPLLARWLLIYCWGNKGMSWNKEYEVCCSVLQCVAVCCSVSYCAAVSWNKEYGDSS